MNELNMEKLNGGLCGLVNFGAARYLNSVLQSFINNKNLLNNILNNNFEKNEKFIDKESLVDEIYKLLKGSWSENCVIVPKSLLITLSQIDDNELNNQNDPDEYYEKILSRLYEETCHKLDVNVDDIEELYDKEWIKSFNKEFSFVNNNFYGLYKSEILCKSCGHKHLSFNPFISLKLELVSDNILSCLKSHLSWEDNITFTCDKCKTKDNAKKRLTLIKVPDTFVMTIKRYNNFVKKNNQQINYSTDFTIDGNRYELYCIINHEGENTFCGHYTSYVKYIKDNNWYHINDNHISKVDINEIDSSDIYMLFYKKI